MVALLLCEQLGTTDYTGQRSLVGTVHGARTGHNLVTEQQVWMADVSCGNLRDGVVNPWF